MKLKRLNQYIEFMEAVQNCEADVYFCSHEGDRLNLKSTLSQILFAAICGDRDFLAKGRVECMASGDYECLRPFLCAESEN